MRVPLSWLLEYAPVGPGTDAAEVARRLTAAGLEVEDAAWRAAAFSADRKEGIAAFVQKREPRWPGA